jgi:psp operon transcriptional activator
VCQIDALDLSLWNRPISVNFGDRLSHAQWLFLVKNGEKHYTLGDMTIIEPDLPSPVGEAPTFLSALAQVSQLASLDRPVLVVGERGTGKELVAARLTYLSPRWDKPFVKLNCATLAESLLDSELFGHEAGAFTGATRRRQSRFEIADGGTLFLDEIATASLAVQEKILRVIEYGAFERVGGNEVHHVDVRVIAATNVDLPALAESGRFRSDLLDRLAFDVVTIPPLRERVEDIPLLADHFARAMTRELGRDSFPGFTSTALARLAAHSWPGNVRELKNVVERSLYRWPRPEVPVDEVVFDPFASPHRSAAAMVVPAPRPAPAAPVEGADFISRVESFERDLLRDAMTANQFNQRRTAEALGITYHQLRHYLKKHKLVGSR